ncbi:MULTISPECIES: hypothetical protein [Tenebrionibacter/Tenebrionicola group]|jgi:hypothetical protein|uniref:Uncharacterized protein n=2 Tax=Tenebrionibacter/Tenebrionicola group TaxID=2969848 RepID=A0A8K0V4P9_9ENTR|nr:MULTISPECIES: hypothetical protein [Tenebrionibacter/Tenebrionicola group]MBK4715671.1 hypothetical protein [Tenebrionibacter intestinalis]MBV5096424.1 hypothetical protein [Tenebrionicola larvae]
MKKVKATNNLIQNGDFEETKNTQWMYSLTGNPIEVSEEEHEGKNSYAEIKTTQSIFQRTFFHPNDSGTITLSIRGMLPVIVSVMDASLAEPTVYWSGEATPDNSNEWKVETLAFALGDNLGSDLCLHFQAKWDQNADATVDIDNIKIESEAGAVINNGDFENGAASWTDSLTGSAIQTSDEDVVEKNHFARIHPTESIFQRHAFKSNQSGTIKGKLRGVLGATVAILDASTPDAKPYWSTNIAGSRTDFTEFTADFNLGDVDGQDLCLHFQADYHQNPDEYVDIDDVSMTINQ